MLVSTDRTTWATLSLLACLALSACKKDENKVAPPNPTAAPVPAPSGAIPTPEQFCSHIDALSRKQLESANAPPDELDKMIAQGHADCVKASTEDAKQYPEWGPCARCSMAIDDLQKMEAACDVDCKTLGEKLDQKAKSQPAQPPMPTPNP